MMVDDEEYQKHAVFTELERYCCFYENLARSVFSFVSGGTGALCNIDSYLLSSIQGTLTSVRLILRDGRINDAYALLRKYHDSAIINVYTQLYLEDNFSIDNFVVEKIDNWLKGKEQLPKFRIMSQYIRKSARVDPITELLEADDRYKKLRVRCNGHMHYNFYSNVLLNDFRVDQINIITSNNTRLHWNYFLALEKDLEAVSRYIEFCSDNLNTYSIELAHLLLSAASEVDTLAKCICGILDPNAKPDNINEYRKIIKAEEDSEAPKLSLYAEKEKDMRRLSAL